MPQFPSLGTSQVPLAYYSNIIVMQPDASSPLDTHGRMFYRQTGAYVDVYGEVSTTLRYSSNPVARTRRGEMTKHDAHGHC